MSKSEYKDNFIIKGGYFLSLFFGIENRSTMDIDLSLKNVDFTKEKILNIVENILEVNVDDGINFTYKKIDKILEKKMNMADIGLQFYSK